MRIFEPDVKPPDVDGDYDGHGGDDEGYVHVRLSLCEDDGTNREASINTCDESDEAIAEAILQCVRGIAALRGSGLQVARKFGGAW